MLHVLVQCVNASPGRVHYHNPEGGENLGFFVQKEHQNP